MGQRTETMRRIIDPGMCILLLFLMAYQVTGEVLHEWIGIIMTVLVITHQILNRKWYGALLRGRYNSYRTVTTAVNILLLLSFLITALAGMSMSSHAVPFLSGMAPVVLARRMHLAMSHWSFVLMGLHLGLHIPTMTSGMQKDGRAKKVMPAVFACIACAGLVLFIRSGMADYMFYRAAFAIIDYEKAGAVVLLENVLMLLFWAFTGDRIAALCRKEDQGHVQRNT